MLVNGNDNYKLSVKQGERVRFYITNAANTRVFNFAIPEARMRLVGADNGKYEREEWVDSVVLSPSERAIVEIWFDTSGDYQIENKTPQNSYSMGSIAVFPGPVTTSYLLVPRINQDFVNSLASFRPLFVKAADKTLNLTLDMMGGGMNNGNNSGGHMMNGWQMMGNNETVEKIEWEDDKGMINLMSNSEMLKWKLIDDATKKENMDIDWQRF